MSRKAKRNSHSPRGWMLSPPSVRSYDFPAQTENPAEPSLLPGPERVEYFPSGSVARFSPSPPYSSEVLAGAVLGSCCVPWL